MAFKKIVLALAATFILLFLAVIGIYNGIVRRHMEVAKSWAQLEIVLQRKSELIPDLLKHFKRAIRSEKDLLNHLEKARNLYVQAKTHDEKINAASLMDVDLTRVKVLIRKVPRLKANKDFAQLMEELTEIEKNISNFRQSYNQSVQDYNVVVNGLLVHLVADGFGFQAKTFFKAAPKIETDP